MAEASLKTTRSLPRYGIKHLIDGDNVLDWPRDLRKGPDVVIAADADARIADLESELRLAVSARDYANDMLDKARTALTASEKRIEAANKLWRICVAEGFPWWDGTVQDKLTEIGLLVAWDMTAEETGPECSNCEGDCETCYRAIEKLEDLK